MQVDFRVGQAPPSDDEIEIARGRLEANVQFGQRLILLVFLFAGAAAWVAYQVVDFAIGAGESSDQVPFTSILMVLITGMVKGVMTIAAFTAVMRTFRGWGQSVEYNLHLLRPLDPVGQDRATAIANKFPEAQAYLQAAIRTRQLKMGDFLAMHEYASREIASKD